MTTRLLSPEDIYDLYGCEEALTASDLESGDRTIITMRLKEIKEIYVAAAKSLIGVASSSVIV